MTTFNIDICYYHFPCSDGVTSAWCIRNKLNNPDVEYVGVLPQCRNTEFIPENYEDKTVIFTDVCPTEEILTMLLEKTKKVIILDHHKTNEALVAKFNNPKLEVIFDMNRSGAQITWDYFNDNENRPWFVDYVGDRDLWKFELPQSKLINLGLYELNYLNFDSLDELFKDLENKDTFINNKLIPYANIIEERNNNMIEYHLKKARKVSMDVNGKTYTIWLGYILPMLRSDYGNRLVNKLFEDGTIPDFAAIWEYNFDGDEWWISFRSKSTDVSEVASHFGGGGHKFASGCTLKTHIRDVFKVITD